MASALITIDQLANPTPVGQPGVARDDILLASPVTLRNAVDTGVTRWRWTVLDVPIGSAILTNATATTAEFTFTPDVAGTYRVQLAINDGAEGEIDTRIVGVRDGDGFLYPAADQRAEEANYDIAGSPNTKNWAKEVEAILRSLGAPQLLNAAPTDTLAISASETFTTAAIGLPSTSSEVVAYDFVDASGGNVGAPPTVNSESFLDVPGANALASICVMTVDLDTSGTTSADVWAVVVVTTSKPILLSVITIA